jgi:hypothetical protein
LRRDRSTSAKARKVSRPVGSSTIEATASRAEHCAGFHAGFLGLDFLVAAVIRFANAETSFFSCRSLISETAFAGSTHWTSRCSSSGQDSLCLFTSNGKTLTSQLTSIPCSSSNLLYLKRPTDFAPIFPLTPASSKASRAADLVGLSPLIGQPLGMIQRLDRRVVTRRISSAASGVNR